MVVLVFRAISSSDDIIALVVVVGGGGVHVSLCILGPRMSGTKDINAGFRCKNTSSE